MDTVVSKDGTRIAYDRFGEGPVLINVPGATAAREVLGPPPDASGSPFTVINYDRRGRGDSGDTPPYTVEREIEDIQALIEANGGSAFLSGHSSGAVLALRAAAAGVPIRKLAVYEPPFIVNDKRPPVPAEYVDTMRTLLSKDKREETVVYFMTTAVGIPEAFVEQMKQGPYWEHSVKVAHTLPYDGMVMADTMSGKPLPPEPWSAISVPTLVMTGGASEPWMHDGAAALMEHLPNAQYRQLDGQDHGVAEDILMPILTEFFLEESATARTA